MVDAPPEPAFRLHLAPEMNDLFLDIPITDALALCLHPVKYLRFLGYCIVGVDGHIATDSFKGDAIPEEDGLTAGVYFFVREGAEGVLEHAVDPQAMTFSRVSETTNTRNEFRDIVVERDVNCVFTNTEAESCHGIHIVPFSKGDAWLKQIVGSRVPEENEDVLNFTSINDIRNGMLVTTALHPHIDKKKLVVLKTPNRVLDCADVPIRSNGLNDSELLGDVKYSTNPRYTLQWIAGNMHQRRDTPNNKDAAFKRHSRKPKPSPLLLNYNYGVAAMKWWGKGPEHLLTARKRPAPPIAAPLGPSRSKHDRSLTITKLSEARNANDFRGGSGGTQGDIDEERELEAENLLLTFYANTAAAQDRHAKRQREHKERLVEWRNDVRVALGT